MFLLELLIPYVLLGVVDLDAIIYFLELGVTTELLELAINTISCFYSNNVQQVTL